MGFSAVAGILDSYGCLRFVVSQRWRFKHYVRPDERLFIVPGLKVQEPVPWDDIPRVIAKVEAYIDEWIRTRNDPAILDDMSIKLYQIRCRKTDHKRAHDLLAIVET